MCYAEDIYLGSVCVCVCGAGVGGVGCMDAPCRGGHNAYPKLYPGRGIISLLAVRSVHGRELLTSVMRGFMFDFSEKVQTHIGNWTRNPVILKIIFPKETPNW